MQAMALYYSSFEERQYRFSDPTLAWQEAKMKRRKVLEAVRLRRRERYRQFMQNLQKRQTIANSQEK